MTLTKHKVFSVLAVALIATAVFAGRPMAVWLLTLDMPTFFPDEKVIPARSDISVLEEAATAYFLKRGFYAENLIMLTMREGDTPPGAVLKDMMLLVDPWGQPYNFDPTQLDPKTGKPLIWSDGPPGSKRPIANWDPGKPFTGQGDVSGRNKRFTNWD